jgi:hypothetical protein
MTDGMIGNLETYGSIILKSIGHVHFQTILPSYASNLSFSDSLTENKFEKFLREI